MAASAVSKYELKNYSMDELSDVVDLLVEDDEIDEDPTAFWEQIFTDITIQQRFLKCLIYKNISYSYGLGHKPLREAMRLVKNIRPQTRSTKLVSDTAWQSSDSIQSGPFLPDISPQKRGRTISSQARRKASEVKSHQGTNRNSIAPTISGASQHSRIKRKSSDNINDDQLINSNFGLTHPDYKFAARARRVLYTISYLINTCDISRWDFNDLRDVFLIWNKARNWEQTACSFEQSLMKRISRPPDVLSDEGRWEQIIIELLNCFHYDDEDDSSAKYLCHQHVGNSIKYVALRQRLYRSQKTVSCLLEAIISIINKMYVRREENKLLSLLHLFCEVVIMAPHVPVIFLQRAYSAIQHLFLLPLPVSAIVKEVLDLIQIEMKAPGYFRRTIYFQEKDSSLLHHNTTNVASCSPTNVFVDKGNSHWNNLEAAFEQLSQRCSNMTSKNKEILNQQIVTEHIFHAVFGSESCDLPTLRNALQTSSESRILFAYTEALSIMEQSVLMENPQHAQEYVRQQLEALSSSLLEEEGDGKEGGEKEESDKEEDQKEEDDKVEDQKEGGDKEEDDKEGESLNKEVSLPVIDESPPHPVALLKSQSIPGQPSSALPYVIAPRRNKSYLSRAVSSEACTIEKRSKDVDITNFAENHCPVVQKMDYSQIAIKNFDKDQLSDAVFELVRSSAKEFVAEKRKSGGAYSSARKRYLERKRSSQFASDERDSGLIEEKDIEAIDERDSRLADDFNDREPTTVHKETFDGFHNYDSSEFWNKFSQEGFGKRKSNTSEDMMDNLMTSFRYSGLLSDDQTNDFNNEFPIDDKKDFSNKELAPENHDEHTAMAVTSSLEKKPPVDDRSDKVVSSKPKKNKSKGMKTWGRFKGIKVMKGIRRNSSMRNLDIESATFDDVSSRNILDSARQSIPNTSTDTPLSPSSRFGSVGSLPQSNVNFFDLKSTTRWRTTSLPSKNSSRSKKKEKAKRGNVKELFSSASSINADAARDAVGRRHSNASTEAASGGSLSKSFSFDAVDDSHLERKTGIEEESPKKDPLSPFRVSSDLNKDQSPPDSESRHRMDSGIIADRSSDDGSLVSPGHNRSKDWEDTGVAGVKFMRKHVLR